MWSSIVIIIVIISGPTLKELCAPENIMKSACLWTLLLNYQFCTEHTHCFAKPKD